MANDDAAALERFRAFVRMRTDHPNPTPGYRSALAMLRSLTAELGLTYRELELEDGHPLGIATWAGSDPSLPSVVLNAHMDVVPAELEKWTQDPWAADVVDGRVYGRGTQDMKSVGMGYVEAIRRLRAAGFAPARTLHLLFVPDEEVGGARGIKLLLAHALVRELNIGLVLDEGLPSPDDKFAVYYGERKIWWLRVRATGALARSLWYTRAPRRADAAVCVSMYAAWFTVCVLDAAAVAVCWVGSTLYI